MGKIFLSCGHEDEDTPNGVILYSEDRDEFGKPAILSGTYCSKCAENLRREGCFEEDEYELARRFIS